jgi:2-polyprenyl-3-methyl-5-hydroxy-6-metoxy-1,4-benzoquinol methylase
MKAMVIRSKHHWEDLDQSVFSTENKDVVTAFEIFEHLLNPYTILSEIKSDIFISIPMRLVFHQLQK